MRLRIIVGEKKGNYLLGQLQRMDEVPVWVWLIWAFGTWSTAEEGSV